MIDAAIAYNRFKFLGFEFLTWLWFVIEKEHDFLKTINEELTSLEIGNRVALENRKNEAIETVIIKGDDAGLEEGRISLKKGAVVTEMNFCFKSDNGQSWQFTLKGESLGICNIKVPETGPVESKDDLEGAILEKIYLYNKLLELINVTFKTFIKFRVSNEWDRSIVPKIKTWISG